MNSQTEIYKQQIEQMAKGQITLDPTRTLLLVVDMVNDGCSELGSFKKMMNADISMFQAIEPNIIALMRACKAAGIPRICVQSIYDFAYISPAMRQRFEAMGIQDGMIAPKGQWGSKIIDTLMAEDPEYVLVKSHYSAFAKGRTLMYKVGGEKRKLEEYLQLPVEYDKEAQANKERILNEYFQDAKINPICTDRLITLDRFMCHRNTIIITGGSTHVCEDAAVSGASERGYHVIESIDAVASEDHDKHYAYLHNHGIFKSQLTTTARLIEAIRKIKTNK